jgi:hypothetical protein
MTKNLWERERKQIFSEITSEFLEEGYPLKEAKRLARIECDEIMADKMNVVDEVFESGEFE